MTPDTPINVRAARNGRGRGPGLTALYGYAREEERLADSQLADLQAVDAEQGGDGEWYTDWRGKDDLGRPGYCAFLVDLRAGRLAWLVVWRLDKLGLGLGGLAELLAELARFRVGFTSTEDGLCLEPEIVGELPAVLEAAAFCQRRLLGDRTSEGMAAAKKGGQEFGGSKRGRVVSVTEEKRAEVAALHSEGRPKAYIARATGLSRDTVYRLVGRPRKRRQ